MGLFKETVNQSRASGTANTPTVLLDHTINGNGVADGDGVRLNFEAIGFNASANIKVMLDDLLLAEYDLAEVRLCSGLEVLRRGSSNGLVVYAGGWIGSGSSTPPLMVAFAPVPCSEKSGLAWGSAQHLKIIGTSPATGGAILQNARVER